MNQFAFEPVFWLLLVAAAVLEVGGDALVRRGFRGGGWPWVVAGCVTLACYGLIVYLVKWDFSKLLGIYVAVFALFSVLTGYVIFGEDVPISTWVGLA